MDDILVKNLVLIGGGHSHVHVIKMLGMKPVRGLQVTLITKDVDTPYSGMLPGYVAGVYTKEECHIDLRKLCSFARIRMVHAEVSKLDVTSKQVFCSDGRPPFRYDVLSIDIGITPRPICNNIGSVSERLTPVKPIDKFAQRWEVVLKRILDSSRESLSSESVLEVNSGASSVAAGGGGNRKRNKPYKVVIVGGGGGGVELAFAVHSRLKLEMTKLKREHDLNSLVKVVIINRSNGIMQSHNKSVQTILSRLAAEKGIDIISNTEVVDARCCTNSNTYEFISKDGRAFEFDEAIWCTQAIAQPWPKLAGLETNEYDGCISVNKTLESVNMSGVFASGDVAHLVHTPRPKAGVFAVRAGPPLSENIRRKLLNKPLVDWAPQDTFLGIVGTGDGYAVASKGPIGLEGAYLWQLKDKIDRFWMSGYQILPDMEEMMKKKQSEELLALRKGLTPSPEEDRDEIPQLATSQGSDVQQLYKKSKMRCGGCGSKVGSQMLERVLKKVRSYRYDRPEVVKGSGDDAALVRIPKYSRSSDASPPVSSAVVDTSASSVDRGDEDPNAPILVHTIDYFKSFISDPYVFGQIAANHALSDIFAMNADPITALALCVLPYGKEDMVEEQMVHLMAGAMKCLSREKCGLVGGHTAEGRDLSLGFSVNGVAKNMASILHKGPPRAGDCIILTKGLGTGVVMAADMRAKSKGAWVTSAIDSMLLSNREAANILYRHGCTACTDVTGFGLMGHLLEMMKTTQGVDDSDNDDDLENDGGMGGGIASSLSAFSSGTDIAGIIQLSKVPLLPGAVECMNLGVLSSLHPQNIRSARSVINPDSARDKPQYTLMFDPQTSGGLVATVPSANADKAVDELVRQGYASTVVIGTIVENAELIARRGAIVDHVATHPSIWLDE